MCTTCGCEARDHNHDHTHNTAERHVKLEADLLAVNNQNAIYNRGYFAGRDVKAYNLVSSPGSGKTALLEAVLRQISERGIKCSVIEGDQETENDAKRIGALGVDVVQINTRNGCHLDAHMVGHAVEKLAPKPGSILFIENVGNLVCPAMFDLGETARVVVVSVTEGDDKPLKYPYMFEGSDICVINKVDLLPYVDSEVDRIKANALSVNHKLRFFETSATIGTGIHRLASWFIDPHK